MKNGTILGMLALLVVGIIATSGAVSAYRGWNDESVKEAIDNEDYDGWKTAMIEGLTEEHFQEVVQHRQQMGNRHGNREEIQESRSQIREAIENEDYPTWKTIIEAMPEHPQKIEATEENFQKVLEVHALMTSGDREGADDLREELGLPARGGQKGGMNRMHRMQEDVSE